MRRLVRRRRADRAEYRRPGDVRLHAGGRVSAGGGAVRIQRGGAARDRGEWVPVRVGRRGFPPNRLKGSPPVVGRSAVVQPKISSTPNPPPPKAATERLKPAAKTAAAPSRRTTVTDFPSMSTIQNSTAPLFRQVDANSRNCRSVLEGDLTSITSSGAPRRLSSGSMASHRAREIAATSAARNSNSGSGRKGYYYSAMSRVESNV